MGKFSVEVFALDKNNVKNILRRSLAYLLVAVLSSVLTITLFMYKGGLFAQNKLMELEKLIEQCFIGEEDKTAMEDAAASAMVGALGDRWSYYIPAKDYASHMEQMNNEYVGIGVTISGTNTEEGFEVIQIEPDGGAANAGMLIGDIITEVEGKKVTEIGLNETKNMIRGDANTKVNVTVLRNTEKVELTITRQKIKTAVATGQMLKDDIGYVKIVNFDARCAEETLARVEELLAQGAKSLVFDVRFNPGGYKKELVNILDYLLPEGALFRSLSYTGQETVDKSDAKCLEMPMAVLINGSSYSAAEFFAAALEEYDWAVTVGEPTVGKSYFQNTYQLSDGSAVGLSVGKYFTPKNVSLADVGGLKPTVTVEVDDTTRAKIYAGQLPLEEDPQVQAAIEALKSGKNP